MFNPHERNTRSYGLEHHLSDMITCLGPPPPEFVLQSPIYSEYFDEEGAWDDRIESPEISIADREANLVGHDQLPFLRFVRRMLELDPENGATAAE